MCAFFREVELRIQRSAMRQCFVIMPIGKGEAYQLYWNRYEHIIEPAVENLREKDEQVFRCVRADLVTKTGSITKDLLRRLHSSDVVIADLTDLNPNVFFELGVRHALRSGTILIALKGTTPPFDLGDLRIIPYEDRVGGEKEAIRQIQSMLRSFLSDDRPQDSPVFDAIPKLAELVAGKENEARIADLLRERDLLKAQLEVSEKTSLNNQAVLEGMRGAIEELTKVLTEPQRKHVEAEIESRLQEKHQEKHAIGPSIPGAPQTTDASVDPESVFVMMPMSGAEFEDIYDLIQYAAATVGLRVYRADSIYAPGPIIDQIFESIAKSGLIVADLTGRNQNVMYELGIAKAMGKDTLLLSRDMKEVPFDIRHERVLVYGGGSGLRGLEQDLVKAFEHYRNAKV